MKSFAFGVFLTLAALSLTASYFIAGGHFYPGADTPVSWFEKDLAKTALGAAIRRREPSASDRTSDRPALVAGMKIYRGQCSGCHGVPSSSANGFAEALFPPAPQLIFHSLHMPESRCFFMTKHGVRWTGMPSWGKMLSDEDIWRVCGFLKNLDQLPPDLQAEWVKGPSGK